MKKSIATLLMVSLSMGMVGCKSVSTMFRTNVQGLYATPSFNYQSILSDKIAVAGVTFSRSDSTKRLNQPMYLSRFENELRDERPTYPVVSSTPLLQSLSSEKFEQVLTEFKTTNAVQADTLALLAQHNYPRYVVFTNVIADNVKKERHHYEAKEKRDGKKIMVNKVRSEVTREMSALTHIYDLNSKTLAWSGTVRKVDIDTNRYDKAPESHKALVILAQALSSEEKLYPYPAVPDVDGLLTKIFDGVAENLPELAAKS